VNPTNETKPVCAICGRYKNLERNHVGGRKHIAWITVLFCKRHHDQFHRLLESVGINLRYTNNKLKRLVTTALALIIALWMVLQALSEAVMLLSDEND
jgi:hypothetical protein